MLIYCSLCLGWGGNLRWFPPYPHCVADASARFRLENNNFMKKSLEQKSAKCCKFGSKRVARWVDELSIMWRMPSMKGGNYRFRQHVLKIMKNREMQTLTSWIFVSSLERKRSSHFYKFVAIVITLVPKWASNWCTWVPLIPESWQRWGLENITTNVTKKVRIFA